MPPTQDVTGRDALGWACFLVHIGFLIFILIGWMLRPVLILYLVFIPAMVLQWRLNQGSCVLNNLESLIRTRRWRNPTNREEGAWLKTLINDVTGLNLSVAQVDLIAYAVMAMLWALGLWRLVG